MMLMTVLTLLWGCSSDDDNNNNNNGQTGNHSTVTTVSTKPDWKINWMSNATEPDWQDPPSSKFECSMDVLVELDDEATSYSTDGDVMAVFIGDECRGVSYRNKMSSGTVAFLLHVKGSSDEIGDPMTIHYYNDGAHHLSITDGVPLFTPSNLMDETYQFVLGLWDGSHKFPIYTELEINLPEELPFTVSSEDMLAVFVDGECRGLGGCELDDFSGWRVLVMSEKKNETAQVRYYSAEKSCIYTFNQTFTLNGFLQMETLKF